MLEIMNKEKYLLTKIQEECAEVSQRAAKAIRFGLKEVQKGQDKNNLERLKDEILDLLASFICFERETGIDINDYKFEDFENLINDRIERINKYMDYSRKLGELND